MSIHHIDLESHGLYSQREHYVDPNQDQDIYTRLARGASTEKMLDAINIQRKHTYHSDCIFNMAVFTFYSIEFFYASIVLCININRGTHFEIDLTTAIIIYDLLYLTLITVRFWHESLVVWLHREDFSTEDRSHHDTITMMSVKELERLKYARTAKCYVTYLIIFTISKLYTIAFWAFSYIVFFHYLISEEKSNSLSLKAFLILYGFLRAGLLLIITLLFVSQRCSSTAHANINRRLAWNARPAEQSVIDKIEVKRYSSSMEGNNECAVCLLDYVEGENIMVLKCDPRHYFHQRCASKWFKTNGICPICRVRV